MENQFKIGDVVRLNSGGPAMTVTAVGKTSTSVECVWFNSGENGWEKCVGNFAVEAIKKGES